MKEKPKKRRSYDAPRRRKQAAATRQAILAAARKLFVERGITDTTIASIAAEAGVSVQMVYAAYQSKPGLLVALLDELERTADAAVYAEAIDGATRAEDQLRLIVRFHCDLFDRGRDVIQVAHRSAGDPVVRAFVDEGERRRRGACERWASGFEAAGALRRDIDVRTAADLLWVHCGFDLYAAFVVGCRWPTARVEEWLVTTLRQLLLRGDDVGGR